MSYTDELSGVWESIKTDFLKVMAKETVSLWFDDLVITGFDNDTLTMETPTDFKRNIINNKYAENIKKAFSDYMGFPVNIEIKTKQSNAEAKEPEKKKDDTNPSTLPVFNEDFTFDSFIEGSSNKFAKAACMAVAEKPATNYNPLFIYGPSGIGKTHLLYAINNKVKANKPDVKIIYVKCEDFTNQFIEALANSKTAEFRNKYRQCDMLLVDDIQFIAGKVSLQEEFFNTFNTLYEEKKQIILTSDRPPREVKTLEDRLKTRFEWGLLADIQPPDFELRTAIIKKKAEKYNIEFDDEVLSFLAENLRSNVRQLEGAVKKLAADNFINGNKITIENAKEIVSDLVDGQISIDSLVNRAFSASYNKYNITRDELTGNKRTKSIANARHITIYLIRNTTDMSLPHIAKIFNRDHTTIMNSIENVEQMMAKDRIFKRDIENLIKEITN